MRISDLLALTEMTNYRQILRPIKNLARSLEVEIKLRNGGFPNTIELKWIRNNGLPGSARKVLLALNQVADSHGLFIALTAMDSRENLIRYYERLGYIQKGEDPDGTRMVRWPKKNAIVTEAKSMANSLSKSGKVRLLKKYGGQVVDFAHLPQPYQLSIAHYMAVDGEAWEAPSVTHQRKGPQQLLKDLPMLIKKYGKKKFLIAELPTDVVVEEINKGLALIGEEKYPPRNPRYAVGKFRERHPLDNRWPSIISNHEDEFLQDGWNRFGVYYHRGDTTIPLIMYL